MASLASILYDLKNEVKGADVTSYVFTEEYLKTKKILIEPLSSMHYEDSDVLIIGNSFLNTFPIKHKNIKTYEEMIEEIANKYYSIAVCGTHGKTTTANMIQSVLSSYYPTSYLIGDGNGHATANSIFFVFEACEHHAHFLSYHPNMIVCTNIDYDHVEYYKTKEEYDTAFHTFFQQSKNVLCLHDSIKYKNKNCIRFGYDSHPLKVSNVKFSTKGTSFSLQTPKEETFQISLPFYGKELFNDVLACIATCYYLNVDMSSIITNLRNYCPAKRRLNISSIKSNIIVDDYGHHPSEIKATIEALKQKYPNKKFVLFYHPDRPQRLLHFLSSYAEVFTQTSATYVFHFLNEDMEKKEAYATLLKISNIYPVETFEFYKQYTDTIFLFTGSKEMKATIAKLSKSLY